MVFDNADGSSSLDGIVVAKMPALFFKLIDMIPLLPREFLWKDFQSMDEFFRLDPINEDFFEVFVKLREEPFAVQADEVKVFNEVYYQVTRIVYEHPLPNELQRYMNDIKANLGWNYSAELVMSMSYFLIALIERNERPINRFFTKTINERFFVCLYWKPFKHRFETLKKERKSLEYQFPPCPYEADWFKDKYIQWKTITRSYDIGAIANIVNLWKEHDDKRTIAKMIENSIVTSNYFIGKDVKLVQPILDMLARYQMPENTHWYASEDSIEYGIDAKVSEIEQLKEEKATLQNRITELEADIERLNALLETNKETGTARKFTLLEIVEYCKGCVEWNDARFIVAMLNKLLRHIGTEEDSELVDSIETEFRQRVYGNHTVKTELVLTKHVENEFQNIAEGGIGVVKDTHKDYK